MFRRRLTLSILFVGTAHLGAFGCAKELEISPPIDPTKVTIAQFDPTNAIPVLRIVPAPTGIVQDPTTGDLLQDRVAPQMCELPSTKQCLQFVRGGWSTSTPITLYFSNEIDESTIKQGIILMKSNGMNMPPTPLDYDFEQSPRPPPPQPCLDQFMIDAADVPPGVQIVLSPKMPIEPSSRYIIVVKSNATEGLKAADGSRVEATPLFHLLNVKPTGDDSTNPVAATGAINNPLLRQNVSDLVIARVAPGKKTVGELTAEEKAAFDMAYTSSGMQLYGLFLFFNSIITPLEASPIIPNRDDVIFANAWSTGPASAPVWEFDPGKSKVPFPNVQLLTRTSTTVNGGLVPAIPNPTNNTVLTAINSSLNGFSTTSSIVMTAAAHVDIASIDPSPTTPCTKSDCAIVMYKLNDQDMIVDQEGVPLKVEVINGMTAAGADTSTITIAPAIPLDQNTEYVVGVKRGITTMDGVPLSSAQTFDFLKSPTAFVDMMGEAVDTIDLGVPFPFKQALQCSTVPTTGALASDTEVKGLATALELLVQHQRWLPAFAALEGATEAISRQNVLMAFTYKTQDITNVVDLVKNVLLDPPMCTAQTGCWEERLPGALPRVIATPIVLRDRNQIVAAIGVVPTLCLPVCELGGMEPAIPRAECATRDMNGNITGLNPALAGNQICQVATNLIVSRIGSIRKYILKGYAATVGGPQSRDPLKPGTFTPASIQTPRVVDIPMWITVPSATTAPSRVVIFQHGLGSVKEAGFYIMNTLASPTTQDPEGWATVFIDLPFHGERASDLINNTNGLPCFTNDPADITCADPDGPGPQPTACVNNNTGMPACDGRRDPSGTGFLGVNLFATRDNFRQATIDQLTLIRALREEGTENGALPFIDGSKIAYIGQSLGSITGGNLAAYLKPTELEGMVLNVGGGGLVTNILLETVPQIAGPLYAQLAIGGVCTLVDNARPELGCQDTPGFRRFRIIAQWILDPGDPLATSIGVTRELSPGRTPLGEENIMMQVSIPDPVVSNQASYALATSYYGTNPVDWPENFQTFDFEHVPQSTVGSGCHGFLLGPLCGECLYDNLCNTLSAQVQAAAFIRTGTLISRNTANTIVEQVVGPPVQCDDLSTPDMNEACQ